MELPSRNAGDRLLKPGECLDIRRRLRRLTAQHDLTAVVVCAFDPRTRMLPFYYSSTRMAPAGRGPSGPPWSMPESARPASCSSSGTPASGLPGWSWTGACPTCCWSPACRSIRRQCEAIIRDACRMDPASRPLIVAGGPKAIYEPWSVFSADPADPWAADVAVTGEEYVLLNLLEVLLAERANGEPLRSAFLRARDRGSLDQVPGLVYARGEPAGPPRNWWTRAFSASWAISTNCRTRRWATGCWSRLRAARRWPPGRWSPGRVRRYSSIGSLVFTLGCKFSCPYCPIPAYNQRQYRVKSARRIADEMTQLHERYGLRFFFGTDDNFFNDRERTVAIVETLSRAEIRGQAAAPPGSAGAPKSPCMTRWA